MRAGVCTCGAPSPIPRLHKLANLHDWNGHPWTKLTAWSPPARLSYYGEGWLGASCVTARRTCIRFFMPLVFCFFWLLCSFQQRRSNHSSFFLLLGRLLPLALVRWTGDNKGTVGSVCASPPAVFIYCKDLGTKRLDCGGDKETATNSTWSELYLYNRMKAICIGWSHTTGKEGGQRNSRNSTRGRERKKEDENSEQKKESSRSTYSIPR